MIPVDLSANCEGWNYDPNGSGIQILGVRSRDLFFFTHGRRTCLAVTIAAKRIALSRMFHHAGKRWLHYHLHQMRPGKYLPMSLLQPLKCLRICICQTRHPSGMSNTNICFHLVSRHHEHQCQELQDFNPRRDFNPQRNGDKFKHPSRYVDYGN